jgi:hypothetical protein
MTGSQRRIVARLKVAVCMAARSECGEVPKDKSARAAQAAKRAQRGQKGCEEISNYRPTHKADSRTRKGDNATWAYPPFGGQAATRNRDPIPRLVK